MGTEYVLAENTYRLGLYHITSGPWCETILKRDFHAEADHFQFPVDRSIYYPRQRTKSNRNLVFFAKPEMPRRCFELGIMALREFHRLRPDVEIVMFGSKHASKQSYEFPVTIREIVPTLDDLAQMYSNGDVGLVFSTTNPSLIPYEMMACGLPVVDLDRGDNEVNYASRRDIALLANPLPEVMATEIAALLENSSELAARREKGLEFINSFPSEEGMARKIEQLIHARIGRRP
jgi:glycosyltransferase involved in cell wall biosynthesis